MYTIKDFPDWVVKNSDGTSRSIWSSQRIEKRTPFVVAEISMKTKLSSEMSTLRFEEKSLVKILPGFSPLWENSSNKKLLIKKLLTRVE